MQTMMKWVQQYASIPFELPNLPHLEEKDRVLYKEQVKLEIRILDQDIRQFLISLINRSENVRNIWRRRKKKRRRQCEKKIWRESVVVN